MLCTKRKTYAGALCLGDLHDPATGIRTRRTQSQQDCQDRTGKQGGTAGSTARPPRRPPALWCFLQERPPPLLQGAPLAARAAAPRVSPFAPTRPPSLCSCPARFSLLTLSGRTRRARGSPGAFAPPSSRGICTGFALRNDLNCPFSPHQAVDPTEMGTKSDLSLALYPLRSSRCSIHNCGWKG